MKTAFVDRVLHVPSYGYANDADELVVPTRRQIIREFFTALNVFADRKRWLAFHTWAWNAMLVPFAVAFFVFFFDWRMLPVIPLYAAAMGAWATIWLHRYGTHRAYTFSHPIFRAITRNLVIKIVPEEIYIVSHHVHHARTEKPGDPYNPHGGKLYCFLADATHQPIHRALGDADYHRCAELLSHTGVKANSYAQYQRWGSVAHPGRTVLHYAVNWGTWFGILFWIGGPSLACAVFTGALWWSIGIRTFNYSGHGGGEDKRRDGVDFGREDLSVNTYFPDGLLAGEYHNNHHLFPTSARCGFLPGQLDIPWLYIRALASLGAVDSYRDQTEQFMQRYYRPYLESMAISSGSTPSGGTTAQPAAPTRAEARP